MKTTTISLAIVILAITHSAFANWQVQFDSEADRVMHMGGDTLRGNFATEAQCQAYQSSRSGFEQNHSRCVGDGGGSDSGSTNTPSGSSSTNRARRGGGDTASQANQESASQAQAEREKQQAFDRGQNELKAGLKGGTSTGSAGLKTGTAALPLKDSGTQSIGLKTYDAAAKEKTIKAIKELNCSAYWAVASLKALDSKNEVATNLEDKYTLARKYGEYSAMAKEGKTVAGCPEANTKGVPDVPPPVDANPQVKLYRYIINQTETLVPDIMETRQKIDVTNNRMSKIEKDITVKRLEIKQIDKKPPSIKKEDDKKKVQEDRDELLEMAKSVKEEVNQLSAEAGKQSEKITGLQTAYDNAQANPERAEDLLKGLGAK